MKFKKSMDEMMEIQALEYVAKLSRLFIAKLRAAVDQTSYKAYMLPKVKVVGTGVGARIATCFCRYAKKYWGSRASILSYFGKILHSIILLSKINF